MAVVSISTVLRPALGAGSGPTVLRNAKALIGKKITK